MSIVSKPATQAYRDWYDRTFPERGQDECDPVLGLKMIMSDAAPAGEVCLVSENGKVVAKIVNMK